MDGDRFDSLVQRLGARGNRRGAIGVLGAIGFGGLFTAAETGLARKKRRKKKCKGDTKKCAKRCIPKTECCGDCGALTCCNGSCVDLATSGANCGACGNACLSNVCANGACKCQGNGNCPGTCKCFLSFPSQAGLFCQAEELSTQMCDSIDDCPFQTVCRQTIGGNFCGTPCVL